MIAEAERDILRAAAARAAQAGRALALDAMPQHNGAEFLPTLGDVATHRDESAMLRNLRMSEKDYGRLFRAYRSGSAAWWQGDAF